MIFLYSHCFVKMYFVWLAIIRCNFIQNLSLYDLLPSLSRSLPFGIPVPSHGPLHTNFYPKFTSGYSNSNPLWTTTSVTKVSRYYQHNFNFLLCYNICGKKRLNGVFFFTRVKLYILFMFSPVWPFIEYVSSYLWHHTIS